MPYLKGRGIKGGLRDGLGKSEIKPFAGKVHRINVKWRFSGKSDALNTMSSSPSVFGLSHPQATIGAKSQSVVTHSQSLMIDKWDTRALEFPVHFFEHHPNDPVPIHLPDEHLTGEWSKFPTGEIPQRFRRIIRDDALRKKNSGDRPHLVQCINRFVKGISLRPVLLPHQTRRVTVKMVLAYVVQRARRYPV